MSLQIVICLEGTGGSFSFWKEVQDAPLVFTQKRIMKRNGP